MALNHLPIAGKTVELQDGTKYAYGYVAAKASKPTFLFLHGFPSSSYDWRFQIKALADLGYGVLAPDLLGYGDTDKPAELEKYRFKKMAADIAEILDKESLGKVIGVGHDWGAGFMGRTVNYYPERFAGLVFVSASYADPTSNFDLDKVNAWAEQAFGYPAFGYWKFFNEENAAEICTRNNESVTSLLYPTTPDIWRTNMTPYGLAKAWIESNTIKPRPSWLSESDAATHNQIFAKGGYDGPLSWYKAYIRNFNAEDDAQISEEQKFINPPTLVVLSDEDYATRAEVAEQRSAVRLRNYEIKKFQGCGHWIQLEKKDEFSKMLAEFGEKFSGA